MQTNHISNYTFIPRFTIHSILSGKGRINRLHYFSYQLLLLLIFALMLNQFNLFPTPVTALQQTSTPLLSLQQLNELSITTQLMLSAFGMGMIYVNIICAIKRLHDSNRTGTWSILLLLPVVNLLLMLYLCFAVGNARANRFGHASPSHLITPILIVIASLVMLVQVLHL
ncbi:uncharacterized membrane protein YhaH (DUF805 family) [Acinetobacter calcoaceticus]|uniref:Uncharacterized membrane protein YhaH (DUF805 family) n=1 Tax=Acinetobacter calcoaceticus TaxID=471 RepID=A0A4R1XY83_ACICA|nr:uncharacterized membrane protein YhaH (DUF805 family) [Acinetobacter calcoaceticus]